MLKVLFCGDTLIQSSDATDPFLFMHSVFAKYDVIVFNLDIIIKRFTKKLNHVSNFNS